MKTLVNSPPQWSVRTLAYELTGHDNGANMFGSADVIDPGVHVTTCPGCGYRTDLAAVNANLVIPTTGMDISCTYDNFLVASDQFQRTILRLGYTGIDWYRVSSSPVAFVLRPTQLVPCDTRFLVSEGVCSECGFPRSLCGPLFLDETISQPLSRGFFATEELFGSGNERNRRVLVGPETCRELAEADLHGVLLLPVSLPTPERRREMIRARRKACAPAEGRRWWQFWKP